MRNSLTRIPRLIATSVVRGSEQGQSHGGIYMIDFASEEVTQPVDWNTSDIDFQGRGWDRGLRGIDFSGNDIYIAASDELFVYDRSFTVQKSYRNRYLKHCHEICSKDDLIILTSTGYDSLLAFDIDGEMFTWGARITKGDHSWDLQTFNPNKPNGPIKSNELHLNMVHVDRTGIYVSGLHTKAMLHIDSKQRVSEVCSLPAGAHNAQPLRNGVLFNDTNADCVRYEDRSGENHAFKIITYDPSEITYSGVDDTNIARQGFGRGLCPLDGQLVAGGSSPSTITIYDLSARQVVASTNLTMDVRNAIHGLEIWPY